MPKIKAIGEVVYPVLLSQKSNFFKTCIIIAIYYCKISGAMYFKDSQTGLTNSWTELEIAFKH